MNNLVMFPKSVTLSTEQAEWNRALIALENYCDNERESAEDDLAAIEDTASVLLLGKCSPPLLLILADVLKLVAARTAEKMPSAVIQ